MSGTQPSRLSVVLAITKVALRTRRLRRQLMFALTVAMMLLVFVGAYPLSGFLLARPWLFIFFWGFSLLLVITVLLLALYDMLRISREENDDLEAIIRRELEAKKKNHDG